MALLLANDEEAIVKDVGCSVIHWQCKKSGPTVCRATRRTSLEVKIKSHEKTQSHLDASIAFGRWKACQSIDRVQEQAIATEATFWRKYLLRIINSIMALAMMSLHGIAREPRTRGQWRLPRWKLPRAHGDASAIRPGPAGSTSNPSDYREYIVRYHLIKTVNAVNEITQHAISVTVSHYSEHS